ncbi:hypothetical protein LOKVESSMR4R_03717 [Yoonia vestfoldensis]|uniref:Uncharacterized protein n=1 Tax=Yoonia vestfoldensis TaxID=245188 RepID=A0A1Y0EH66_9RHOB|nr:hypothetical protein LOKVESSMR4R_03717 [Yoonia vestfoldensis]
MQNHSLNGAKWLVFMHHLITSFEIGFRSEIVEFHVNIHQ